MQVSPWGDGADGVMTVGAGRSLNVTRDVAFHTLKLIGPGPAYAHKQTVSLRALRKLWRKPLKPRYKAKVNHNGYMVRAEYLEFC
jgi:hypothetical protein